MELASAGGQLQYGIGEFILLPCATARNPTEVRPPPDRPLPSAADPATAGGGLGTRCWHPQVLAAPCQTLRRCRHLRHRGHSTDRPGRQRGASPPAQGGHDSIASLIVTQRAQSVVLHPEFISAYRPFIKWSITWRQWLRGETARGIVGDGER